MRYSFIIVPRLPALGGGWNLRLLDGETEVGGGAFPIQFDAAAAADWWRKRDGNDLKWWLERTVERGAASTTDGAYTTFLLDEACADADAEATAYDWLDSRE